MVCEGCNAQLRIMTAREVACPFCQTMLPAAEPEQENPGWQRVSHADIFGRISAPPAASPRPLPSSPEAPPARLRRRFDAFDPERTHRSHLLAAEAPSQADAPRDEPPSQTAPAAQDAPAVAPNDSPKTALRTPRIEPERPHERRPRQPTPPRLRAVTPHEIIDVSFELPAQPPPAPPHSADAAADEDADAPLLDALSGLIDLDALDDPSPPPAPLAAPREDSAAQQAPTRDERQAPRDVDSEDAEDIDNIDDAEGIVTLPMRAHLAPPPPMPHRLTPAAPAVSVAPPPLADKPAVEAVVEPPIAPPLASAPAVALAEAPSVVAPPQAERSRELRTVVEPSSTRQIRPRAAWITAPLIALASFLGGWGAKHLSSPDAPTQPAAPIAAAPPASPIIELPRDQAIAGVMQSASLAVALATTIDPSQPRHLRAAAADFVQREDWGRATVALDLLHAREPHTTQDERLTHARALTQTKQFARARLLLIDAMVDAPTDKALIDLFNKTIQQDEALHPKTLTLTPNVQADTIHALGGGRSIVLRLTLNDKNVFVFKPYQREWSLGWRAEIAAFHLCAMIACPFNIPKNIPARISREDFEAMYGKKTSAKQQAYRERFGELVWRREVGPDGAKRDYLYGTLKDWVPDFVGWPIEHTGVWRHLLAQGADAARLDEPLLEATSALKPLADGAHWRAFMKEREAMDTRELARQLSALLTFDYITTNWDRFSTVPQFYGVNNQLRNGRFLSLDNGAAFYINRMAVVESRLKLVQRFDKRLITAIRALDPASVEAALFPEPDAEARARLDLFWAQRRRLLAHVDALVAAHGEEAVYALTPQPTR